MTDPFFIGIINLAAGLLVFFSAIIPISYKIWQKTRGKHDIYTLKIILLGLCSIILYAVGLVWAWISGPEYIVFLLVSGGFAFYVMFFYIQNTPIDRQSVILLVLQSMIVVLTLLLYFVGELTEIVEKIVNG